MTEANQKVESTRKSAWVMFDRIAHRYDLLNRLLSFRQDVNWRNKIATYLPEGEKISVLDVATGTADLLISMLKKSERIGRAVGIDMSKQMLHYGQLKLQKLKLTDRIELLHGDATDIQFKENSFDALTISFGIRNVNNLDLGLQNFQRVLKPGGRAIILEFSLPENALMRSLYLFYFRKILPLVGGLISGDSYAYNYLNESVESFPYGQEFCNIMERNGFTKASYKTLTFGIASIYVAEKA